MKNSEIKRGDLVTQDGKPFVIVRVDSDRMAQILPGDSASGWESRRSQETARWVYTDTLRPRQSASRKHLVQWFVDPDLDPFWEFEGGTPGEWRTEETFTGPASYAEALEAARKVHARNPRGYYRVALFEITDTFGPAAPAGE